MMNGEALRRLPVRGTARSAELDAAVVARHEPPDARRRLQLALAALWLLDALLQAQAFMFTRGFAGMLAQTAHGNPAPVAMSVLWAARLTGQHAAAADAVFAGVQLALALGIAWRPTTRLALAASVAWAAGVWWLGEGLGGILAPDASPLTGAPGAAVLYALLAVLLWPVRDDRGGPFVAARPLGTHPARLVWALLWGSLAWLAIAAASPQGPGDLVTAAAAGQPGWIGGMDRAVAAALAGRGVLASACLAAVLGVAAVGVFLPARACQATLVLSIVVAAVIWVAGQDFGGIFTGSGTDPNSGPLLALLAAGYWPRGASARPQGRSGPGSREPS